VKLSRQSFFYFLTERKIASHTDNLLLRMLLWPHPKIPDDDFIKTENREQLLAEGRQALSQFDFVGLIEDEDLPQRMGRFLGTDIAMYRANETVEVASALQPALSDELDERTLSALYDRSYIDDVLWKDVAATIYREYAPEFIAERSFLRTLFHYANIGIARLTRASR
jgi:hypothetical protein